MADSTHPGTILVGTKPRDDTAEFLRQRLRDCCLAIQISWFLWVLSPLLLPVVDLNVFDVAVTAISLLVMLPALAALLWYSSWTVAKLRLVELFVFGSSCLTMAILHVSWVNDSWYMQLSKEEDNHALMEIVGDSLMLWWLLLIVIYGSYVPNTWKRCAAVVVPMGLLPIILTFPELYGLQGKQNAALWKCVPEMVVTGSSAIVIAVISSLRNNMLRQEVIEGRRLGQYKLRKKLGTGGMGEVYLAEHHLLRRACAVKVIRADLTMEIKTLTRFQREVNAMAGLTHWNIVRVYDYGVTPDGTFYYVMEYLDGLDLDDLVMQHRRLEPERVIYLLRQVCWALHEAHHRGLVHRDIKPSNIMLCEQGLQFDVVKLADFGLVHDAHLGASEEKLTVEGRLLGTPAFMSPEQLGGQVVDARSDLYSLGVVAYYLLTGANPFARANLRQTMTAHLVESPPVLAAVCPAAGADLTEVVMRCLEKNPEDRFQSAAELESALAHCKCEKGWDQERAQRWWQTHGKRDDHQSNPYSSVNPNG